MAYKFHPGQIVATPGALEAFREAHEAITPYLLRHLRGDWGTVCREDWKENDRSLVEGSRLLSAYQLSNGVRIWIITEATGDDGQRASTCILLPSDY
jgi:hypothetical protein